MASQDVYEIVTNKIIQLLEAGEIPWQKPWNASGKLPQSLISGKEYQGINHWNLALSGYGSPYWLTYKQAKELGGNVRKGEKGTPIIFFKILERENSKGDTDSIPLARYSTVFNLSQCEGIESPKSETPVKEFTPIESAELVSGQYLKQVELRHGGDRAYYSPSFDYIQMPERVSFRSPEEYYSTLFHEMAHSTGHEKRLNREELQKIAGFGSHDYSKEELVAEMASSFLCHNAGISQPVIENQAAYIRAWLSKLKNDRKFLVSAASKAQKATKYILEGVAV
jgi:antirestriction protein ArdC